MSIHQEIVFDAAPARVYEALMNEAQHSTFTGGPAEIDRQAGGAFSCHGGRVTGRTIEVVPNERIIQAWRVGAWDDGVYSIVRFELKPEGAGTRLVLDHAGFPDGMATHLEGGWHKMYWDPLKSYLDQAERR